MSEAISDPDQTVRAVCLDAPTKPLVLSYARRPRLTRVRRARWMVMTAAIEGGILLVAWALHLRWRLPFDDDFPLFHLPLALFLVSAVLLVVGARGARSPRADGRAYRLVIAAHLGILFVAALALLRFSSR